jgi:hypothetical protein
LPHLCVRSGNCLATAKLFFFFLALIFCFVLGNFLDQTTTTLLC